MSSKKNRSADVPKITQEYITLRGEGEAEYTEKKSVFLAHACPVKSSVEACEFIKKVKSEYSDARHTVYAYLISFENATRYSDDGEPHGTAGIPVLNVIQKGGFTDAVITVSRYFGGILLGASGLLRAYTTAASAAVKEAGVVHYVLFTEFFLLCNYSDYQKFDKELTRLDIRVDSLSFEGEVELHLAVRSDKYEKVIERLCDITSGRLKTEQTGTRFDF